MTRSLSGRLLIGVITLVVAGLLISDLVTYGALKNFLISRVDDQLASNWQAAIGVLGGPSEAAGPGSSFGFPPGTVVELVGPDGTLLTSPKVLIIGSTAPPKALPVLPHTLVDTVLDHPSAPYTVAGTGGVDRYRVIDWREDSFAGNFVLLAIPMSEVESTLGQLLTLEAVIGAGVVAAVALLALLIIRIGLRPLERMGAVARDIAAGDLTRRVEPATPNTEIGRLGLALNGMLGQIESAFAERTRSESRLRRFIADASHELRTPLTSVRGYAEMLRRGAEKSPADSAVARRRIEEESVRMSVMVDDMLVLARLGQGRPLESVPVDLQAISRDAVADAKAVAPQREVTLSANGPVVVRGDDTRLRQAVGNLVRNAIVHTPADTSIEVGVRADNGVAHLYVTDHGPGLRSEDSGRVFEPFYRGDPSRSRDSGGAGLGLSIVSAVVAAHGGSVRVADTPGGGATFEIDLPVVPKPDELALET